MSGASSKPDKPAGADVLPPDGSRPKLARVPWNPWLGVAFIIVLFYLAQLTAGLLISAYPLAQGWSESRLTGWLTDSVYAQFGFILLSNALILGALYLFLKRYRSSFKAIGLVRPRRRDVGYGVLAVPVYYAIYLIFTAVVSQLVPGLDVDQEQQIGFDQAAGFATLSVVFVSLVILPAFTEEIVVRGFLYGSLRKALRIVPAALAASLIFAAAHLSGGADSLLYIAAIDTFVLSLVLIYLREKTGSLWASITLHGIKNSIAFLAIFVFHIS